MPPLVAAIMAAEFADDGLIPEPQLSIPGIVPLAVTEAMNSALVTGNLLTICFCRELEIPVHLQRCKGCVGSVDVVQCGHCHENGQDSQIDLAYGTTTTGRV
eukprot:GHUV01025886.1.p1 GENE.GHUV01025886.1~~GHUV01025886.1.p1  ORF type:complete len:102 (+),score=23.92 GHUV01025886.1:1077-1382(+)